MASKLKKAAAVLCTAMLAAGGTIVSPPKPFAPVAHAAWSPPVIQYPASVYWGGYSNNDQLVQDGARWEYVKKYADGFHFHTAYWGSDVRSLDTGLKFAWALGPYKPQFTAEGGLPHPALPADGSIGNIGTLTGQGDANAAQIIGSWGVRVNEVITNYNLYMTKMIKNAKPDYNSQDLLAALTGDRATYPETAAQNDYWVDYFKEIVKSDPDIRYSHFNSPVYLSWYGYPAVSDSFMNFRDVSVTGDQFIQSAFKAANDDLGKKMTAFASDMPYGYYTTYNQAAKLQAYESWLHANGYLHSLTINADSLDSLTPAQQDQQYYNDSMAYVKKVSGRRGGGPIATCWNRGIRGPIRSFRRRPLIRIRTWSKTLSNTSRASRRTAVSRTSI
ncbi:hypothetical protein [Cohnella rhizosphaerae]|uniref:Uncharacterized protein n=1 Tax=Cohnella rhizosphaerae TaxID=1457232 RepID=A0A9X4KYX3_9BACL|nr:hypothetical protein [Cohnella rhizosphaerae]MDG0813855.1 hypothetical protein [Cohnella rhizosphaerae]